MTLAVRRQRVLTAIAAAGVLAAAAPPASRPADHVVLISIDGLVPEYYIRPQDFGLALPNLRMPRVDVPREFCHSDSTTKK